MSPFEPVNNFLHRLEPKPPIINDIRYKVIRHKDNLDSNTWYPEPTQYNTLNQRLNNTTRDENVKLFNQEKISRAKWDYGTLGLNYCVRKLKDQTTTPSEKAVYFAGAVASGIGILTFCALGPVGLALAIFAGMAGGIQKRKELTTSPYPKKEELVKFADLRSLDEISKINTRRISSDTSYFERNALINALRTYKDVFLLKYESMKDSEEIARIQRKIDFLSSLQ